MFVVLTQITKIGPREFHAGTRVALAPYKRGITDGTKFLDPWRNPYLVRGVPQEEAEMHRPLNEVRRHHHYHHPSSSCAGVCSAGVDEGARTQNIYRAITIATTHCYTSTTIIIRREGTKKILIGSTHACIYICMYEPRMYVCKCVCMLCIHQ